MCKPPIKTPHFEEIVRMITDVKEIKNHISEYRKVMNEIYQDLIALVCNNMEIISRVYSREAINLKDRIEQSDSLKKIVREYSSKSNTNITLIRHAINHIMEILKEYCNKSKKKAFSIDTFWDYAKPILNQKVDVVLSIKTVNGVNVYRINVGKFLNSGKNVNECSWQWLQIKIDKEIDAETVAAKNTQKGQDMDRPSQHKESSRLVIRDDNTYLIEIKMKKEEPIANPHGGIMAIDVGLNRFLTILSYSLSDNKGKSILVEDQDLLNNYKTSIDRGNAEEINAAILKIQQSIITRLNDIIDKRKPKYIIIENIREGLEKTESTWTNSFPWIDHQCLLANSIAAKGVYVIWINPHSTSSCHAYSNDSIVRDSSNHSIGHCKGNGEKVDCDKNAVLNILSRGIIKILIKFVLEDKVSEIKEYADQKGFMINELNYAAARDIVDFCKERYGLNLSEI